MRKKVPKDRNAVDKKKKIIISGYRSIKYTISWFIKDINYAAYLMEEIVKVTASLMRFKIIKIRIVKQTYLIT